MKNRGAVLYRDYEQEIKELKIKNMLLMCLLAMSAVTNVCLLWWAQTSLVGG